VKTKSANATLALTMDFDIGEGISTNIESGLLRPFKYILFDGKPIGKITFVFYEDEEKYYVVGTLCKSEKKLIFFPGGDKRELILNKNNLHLGDAHIDHFTLDENFNTWHITLKEKKTKKKKIPQYRTWRINDNLILWFVLQARSVNDFEKMPKQIKVSIEHTNSDIDRISKEIINARDGSIFQITKVNNEIEKPHIINFEFFISQERKVILDSIPIYFNTPQKLLLEKVEQLPSRTHHVKIPNFESTIVIRVTKIPGIHDHPWNFNPGSTFKKSKSKRIKEFS